MKAMMNIFCKFLIIGMLGIVSTQASGYEEYLKELGVLKKISFEAHAKKPEGQVKIKSEHNELAREVNRFIDYFIQIVDGKAAFNFSEIERITKHINLKASKLKNDIDTTSEQRLFVAPNDIDTTSEQRSFVAPLIGGLILLIPVIIQAYEFIKKVKDDYEKYQIKNELKSYKWEEIE